MFAIAALLAKLDALTSHLRDVDLTSLLAALQSKNSIRSSLSDEALEGIIVTFRILLVCPMDYIGRVLRGEYVRRAYVADIIIQQLSSYSNEPQQNGVDVRTLLRMFLARVAREVDTTEVLVRHLSTGRFRTPNQN